MDQKGSYSVCFVICSNMNAEVVISQPKLPHKSTIRVKNNPTPWRKGRKQIHNIKA